MSELKNSDADQARKPEYYDLSAIEAMEIAYGTVAAAAFCHLSRFKYLARRGKKPGQKVEIENTKIARYEELYEQLIAKIGTCEEVHGALPDMGAVTSELSYP